MDRIFRVIGKEYSNINQAALLLGLFAFLSQILGLIRDRAFAHYIGPGIELDIYYVAFRVPDFIFISIASLFSVTVLVPFILAKMKDGKVTKEAEEFVNNVFTMFLYMIITVSTVVFFLMPVLVDIVAPGFEIEAKKEVITLSRIMLFSPILLGLSNLFGSITQLFRKFFIYSLSPIFYNLGIILGVLFIYPRFGVLGIAFGVVLGALLHFLIQAFASYLSGFKVRFIRYPNFKEIKGVLFSSIPRTLGLASNSIALLVLVALASYLSAGSISIFNLSLTLQSVTLTVIGLSYAVAVFPLLSSSYTKGDMSTFKLELKRTARAIIFWSVPLTFIFIVLRAQIVRVVLGSPTFSWEDTRLVAASLAVFSISIVAQGMIALLARAYYAVGNTKRPLIINFVSSILIVLFAFLFLHLFERNPSLQYFFESFFRISDVLGTEMLMLPLAYSLGTIVNFILLWISIKIDFLRHESFIRTTFGESLGAGFFVGLASYFSLNILSSVFGTNTFWGIFAQGFFAGAIGATCGGVVLYFLGNQEFKDLLETVKSKFWKADIVVPSPEEKL